MPKIRAAAGERGRKPEIKAPRQARQNMSTPETSPQPGDTAHAPPKRVGRSLTDPESPDPKTRMEGENGTPQIILNGNHAGRKREAPGALQPIQEVSYLSKGRTRERMAIGVIPLTRNGPSHLIYRARGWTAHQRRLHRDCVLETRGSGKSLERR